MTSRALRFFLLILFLASLPSLFAFDPVVNTVYPRGGELGTQVKFTLFGDRLDEPEEFIFYRTGITVSDLRLVDKRRIKGTFTIAPDAPLGEHPFRLRTKQGVSYLRTFWVLPFPNIKEANTFDQKRKITVEENDTFDEPQAIVLNTVIQGIARKEDVDYYCFEGKKGQRVTIEVFGMRLGRSLFDPYLALLDSESFELATSDDTVLTKRDPFISLNLPADGDYTILVRESSYQGGNNADYLLQVSESPRPTSVHPPVGQTGQRVELTFREPTGKSKQTVTLPKKTGPTPIFALSNGRKAPSPNLVLVTDFPIKTETEPNVSFEALRQQAAAIPHVFHGVLNKANDRDWFCFTAKKGQNVRIQVYARSLRSPVDPVIGIRDANDKKNLGSSDDDGNNPDSKFDLKVPHDGNYYLLIRDHLNRGGPDYTYVVEVTHRTPSLSAELPYARNNDSQKNRMIVIPRGNHLAIVPNVARQNTTCDVLLQHDILPKGVSVESKPAPRSPPNFPILFSAAKDAPLASTLTTFTIKDPKSRLSGPFGENIHHVEINNTGAFCSTHNDRLTVAVIEEAPFHLEITSPEVPLVRNGTMALVVRAKRSKDYKEDIKIKMPWTPPGIGAPPEVTIPADKNEVTIPINANSEAPIRSWSILVTGEAKTKMGNVRVSSPFVTLDVAEPYLSGSIDLATTKVGKDVTLTCELETLQTFDGEAQLTLGSLPHGVTAQPVSIKAGDKTVKIPLKVPADVKPGKSKNIFAQVLIMKDGQPIPHQIASGTTLVITPPLAKK